MKPAPTSRSESTWSDPEALSSIVDGEADAAGVRRVAEAWRDDAEVRASWHTYQLIGDVLRSDELAGSATRDAALLAAVRARLAAEPVVLAPAPAPRAAHPRTPRWLVPGAVAAGFVVVAGVVLVLEQQVAPTSSPTLAAREATTVAVKASAGPAASVPSLVTDGRVLRDARLDAYLDAHRGAVGGLPSALPGGGLRNVELLVPGR